jgi:iron complex outermembrane receptor protein
MLMQLLAPYQSKARHAAPLALAVLLGAFATQASADMAAADNFASLSLEELGQIEITSVSKKAEKLTAAAAPVFVISADDIRRSGALTLPEALRLAPNLQVARVDSRNYAITARGFNTPFANKLLVLVDGRAIYSPLFSGVFWDAQDVVLEDVERIEVISGPGATLWGANAVNGVINIITRSAAETHGGYMSVAGDADINSATIRYGGKLGGGNYRVYAKSMRGDDGVRANGAIDRTGWKRDQLGFRIDSGASGLSLQGDVYDGKLHQDGTADIAIGGANLVARMNRRLAGGSELRLQAYLDHTQRKQPGAFVEHLNTVDFDAQQSLALSAGHHLVWGGGHRVAYDRVQNGSNFGFLPASRNLAWTNLFAQDDFLLAPTLRLTAGLKAERNSYTGVEYLPHLNLAWQLNPSQLLWGSLARAVRVPSRIDNELYAPTSPPLVDGVPQYVIGGGPGFVSEVAKVAQIGLRGQPRPTLSYAATLYFSRYDRLRTTELNPSGPGFVFLNGATGTSRGAELSARWDVQRNWRMTAGLSAQSSHTEAVVGSIDAAGAANLTGGDPSVWGTLRSSFDLSERLELDLNLRHVGKLRSPEVKAYTALDVRVGWKIMRQVELAIMARNLIASDHAEYGAGPLSPESGRTLMGRLSWRF